MSNRTIEHLEIVADFLEQMTDRDSYAVYVREAAKSLARLQAILKPFTQPDLHKLMVGNFEGDASIVFQRDKAVLTIGDFSAAAEAARGSQ